jgi:hypothetical protein
MSKYIYVNVQRVNGSMPVLSGIRMQLDNIDLSEELYYEGVAPVERFAAYAFGIYDIRQTDILMDTTNIDPVTNTNYRYRVISIPESFFFHTEMTLDLLRGSM